MSSVLPVIYTAVDARAKFKEIMNKAKETEIFIARNGRTEAVILGTKQYQELIDSLEMLENELMLERAKNRLGSIEGYNEETISFEEIFGEAQ